MSGLTQNNPDLFKTGVRVRLNEAARAIFPMSAKKSGAITSRYPREQLVYLLWDGNKIPTRYHVDFLEVISS